MNEEDEKRFKKSQEEYEEWNNKLKELGKNAIIEVFLSGAGDFGFSNSGYLVTSNKEIYKFLIEHSFSFHDYEKHESFISKMKDLTDEGYKKVTDFIENELLSTEFEEEMIFDASFYIIVNYNGVNKEIKNNMEIYDKAKDFLGEMADDEDLLKRKQLEEMLNKKD